MKVDMVTKIEDALEYMVTVDENGTVSVRGGLIFYPGRYVLFSRQVNQSPKHSFSGTHFISQLPRWWQVPYWWRILRAVLRTMNPKKENKNVDE